MLTDQPMALTEATEHVRLGAAVIARARLIIRDGAVHVDDVYLGVAHNAGVVGTQRQRRHALESSDTESTRRIDLNPLVVVVGVGITLLGVERGVVGRQRQRNVEPPQTVAVLQQIGTNQRLVAALDPKQYDEK
jgi:hypothetical protein